MVIKILKVILKIVIKLLKLLLIFPFQIYTFSKTFDIDKLHNDLNDIVKD